MVRVRRRPGWPPTSPALERTGVTGWQPPGHPAPRGRHACRRCQPSDRSPVRSARQRRGAGPPPAAATLHDAALDYLARYAATEAGLLRVLERRVDRWARLAVAEAGAEADVAGQASEARRIVREVVRRLVAAGAVNDRTFAESRSRTLIRAGRSRLAVAAASRRWSTPSSMRRSPARSWPRMTPTRSPQRWHWHGDGASGRSGWAGRPIRRCGSTNWPSWRGRDFRNPSRERRSQWRRMKPRHW